MDYGVSFNTGTADTLDEDCTGACSAVQRNVDSEDQLDDDQGEDADEVDFVKTTKRKPKEADLLLAYSSPPGM